MDAYPKKSQEVASWCHENKVPLSDGKIRLAQYAVIYGISKSRYLRENMVLKGGNSLRLSMLGDRSTKDIDFTVLMEVESIDDVGNELESKFAGIWKDVRNDIGVNCRIQSMSRQPSKEKFENPPFGSWEMKVGYSVDSSDKSWLKIQKGVEVSSVVPLDISVGDLVCDFKKQNLHDGGFVKVVSVEDMVAEKLRALLQQTIRNRNRPQDVIDIYGVLKNQELNNVKVLDFLQRKSKIREVPCDRGSFHNEDLWNKARVGFDAMNGASEIDFEEAQRAILEYVDQIMS